MTCNLIVPYGKVRFVFFNEDISTKKIVEVGVDNYCRITVKPKLGLDLRGLNSSSLILNISDIPHNPRDRKKRINSINFD